MKRWLTTSELGDVLATRYPKVAKLTRWRRAEYARRLVERMQRVQDVQCVRRSGRRVLISVRALEFLLPSDKATVDRLEVSVEEIAQGHRKLNGRVNGHGSLLRDHERRLKVGEKKAEILARGQQELANSQEKLAQIQRELQAADCET